MSHILVLTGFSGCGKDSVARVLEKEHGYKFVVSTTTRPKRSNEKDGVEYYFKTNEEFQKLIDNNLLVEYRSYNTIQNGKPTVWHYGIEKKEFDLEKRNYVVACDLKGLEDLKRNFGSKVISCFIDVDEESRRLRAIVRDRNFELTEWNRRWEDDKKRFYSVKYNVDFIVKNYDFKKCIENILKQVDYRLKFKNFFESYCSY